MIVIPSDVLFGATLGIGTVYYYQSDHLVTTKESHYFVVLAHNDSTFHVVCATSQIEKRKEFVRIRKLPIQTLVEVAPTTENGLRKASLFDCNSLYEETLNSLKRKHEQKTNTGTRVHEQRYCAIAHTWREGKPISSAREEINLYVRAARSSGDFLVEIAGHEAEKSE